MVSALHLAPGDGTVLAEPVGRALASGLDEACRLELRSLASSGALNSPSLVSASASHREAHPSLPRI